MSLCKGCGRPIEWIRTQAGKSMPVDPDPVFVIEGQGPDTFVTDEGVVIRGQNIENAVIPRGNGKTIPQTVAFVPHWKTCPNAGDFRRK